MKSKKILSLFTAAVTAISILPTFGSAVSAAEPDFPNSEPEELTELRSSINDGFLYSGNVKEATAVPSELQITVIPDNNSSVTYGNNLTLKASVSRKQGGTAPLSLNSDTVYFYIKKGGNDVLLGTAEVSYTDENTKDSGTATLIHKTTDKLLETGNNTIYAKYGGSTNLNSSNSSTVSVTLNKKEIVLDWKNHTGLLYDGNKKNVTAETADFINGDNVALRITGGDEANAGNNYTATASLTGNDAKYYALPTSYTQAYTISPKAITATIADIPDQTYTENAITPQIRAFDGDVEISPSEYTVQYTDNINKGTATATLIDNPNGNYTVNGTKTFKINPKSIDNAVPSLIDSLTYNGQEQTQNVALSLEGYSNVTFDVSGNKQTDVNPFEDYTLTITANGNFTGTKTLDWNIMPYELELDKIEATIENKVYDGTSDATLLPLGYEGVTLVYGIDYAYMASFNNEKSGTAKPVDVMIFFSSNYVCNNFSWLTITNLTANIDKASPIESQTHKTTASAPRGRSLAAAFVADGEMLAIDGVTPLTGMFSWVNSEKIISADSTEQRLFTPDDENYKALTINVPITTYRSGGSLGTPATYTISFVTNGGSTLKSLSTLPNTRIEVLEIPEKDGYRFDSWYTDKELTSVFDFDTRITKNITLYAKWIEYPSQEPTDDSTDLDAPPTEEYKNPFTDVKESDWFFKSVMYVSGNKLMSGTTSTEFTPSLNLTRGMLAVILWKAAGEPQVDYEMLFTDVSPDSYYAEAIRFAASEKLVSGISETKFAPNDNITREQIAAILYRYAKYKGFDVSVGEDTNILSYTDFGEISEYAVEALQYAVGSGLIKGKTESTLNPKDNATRAEIAAIIQRFFELNK